MDNKGKKNKKKNNSLLWPPSWTLDERLLRSLWLARPLQPLDAVCNQQGDGLMGLKLNVLTRGRHSRLPPPSSHLRRRRRRRRRPLATKAPRKTNSAHVRTRGNRLVPVIADDAWWNVRFARALAPLCLLAADGSVYRQRRRRPDVWGKGSRFVASQKGQNCLFFFHLCTSFQTPQ